MGRIQITRVYHYQPLDIAVAFKVCVTKMFGNDCFSGARIQRFFSLRLPVPYITIKPGPYPEITGINGEVLVKKINGRFAVGEHGSITAIVPVRYKDVLDDLLRQIDEHLKENSIYKRRAFKASGEFLDVSRATLSGVVYNKEVWKDLNAHLWTMIERPDDCLKQGIKLQRKILFAGPYGSGKTLAAYITAMKAVQNGWSFIYIEPTLGANAVQLITSGLNLGEVYQRSVVFFEDLDREQRQDYDYLLGSIMNQISGFTAQDSEMIIVMTTNFPDKVSGALQRPGRIDKIIDFSAFTPDDAAQLLKESISPDILAPDINWENVVECCADYTQAFITKGVVESSKLLAISEAGGKSPVITEEILVHVAQSLRQQYNKCSTKLGFGGIEQQKGT